MLGVIVFQGFLAHYCGQTIHRAAHLLKNINIFTIVYAGGLYRIHVSQCITEKAVQGGPALVIGMKLFEFRNQGASRVISTKLCATARLD